MRIKIFSFGLTLSLALSPVAHAGKLDNGERSVSAQVESSPVITDAWVRATVPGQSVGSAYMRIESRANIQLIHVETDAAREVQVHTMHIDKGIMKMRERGEVPIPAGTAVDFTPGGLHFMMLGLKRQLRQGEMIRLKMTFKNTKNTKKAESTLMVNAFVRPIGYDEKDR